MEVALLFQRPKRASFISTVAERIRDIVEMGFQRPKRASFISTDTINRRYIYGTFVFQRPKRASFISTKSSGRVFSRGGVFQRPKRASFISTVPSGNPHKHWLSSLIFAGICLNILTLTVF